MLRRAAVCYSFLVALSFCPPPLAAQTTEQLATVVIVAKTAPRQLRPGVSAVDVSRLSAVVVRAEGNRAIALTAAHLFDGAPIQTLTVQPIGHRPYAARVLHVDHQGDVAVVVFTADRPMPAMPIGVAQRIGESAVMHGYPSGSTAQQIRAGQVRGVYAGGDRQYTFGVIEGDSGGPVFSGGRVVGIVSAKATSSNGYGPAVVVPGEKLAAALAIAIDETSTQTQPITQSTQWSCPTTPTGRTARTRRAPARQVAPQATPIDYSAQRRAGIPARGSPGERGPQGPPGEPGPPGAAAEVDYQVLINRLAADERFRGNTGRAPPPDIDRLAEQVILRMSSSHWDAVAERIRARIAGEIHYEVVGE